MRLFRATLALAWFAGLAAAQCTSSDCSSTTSSTSTSSTSSSTSSVPASTSSTSTSTSSSSSASATSSSTVTVNQDGTAQFTAINAAVSYAQAKAIPTVYVRAGTYNEAVSVIGSAAVTIVGETTASNDYSQNKVIISNSGVPMTIGTNAVTNTAWRNINFVTSSTGNTAYAVSLRGTKNAFYYCQMVSAGNQAIYSTYGITFIAGSYVEAVSQTFAGYLGMYVFNSTITATSSSALLLYSKGQTGGANSQVAFDSCTFNAKSGSSATGVYLAAPNANGSQAIWRNSYLGSFINSAGVHPLAASYADFYGEYNTQGAGSYSSNTAKRSAYDICMTTSQLSGWSVSQVFGNSFSGYSTSDTTWIDSTILSAISSADSVTVSTCAASSSSSTSTSSSSSSASSASATSGITSSTSSSVSSTVSSTSSSSTVSSSSSQVSSTSSTLSDSSSSSSSSTQSTSSSSSSTASPTSSSSSSSSSSTSSDSSSSTSVSATTTSSSVSSTTTSASSSTSASSNCTAYTLPTSMPSTAKVVGPSGSCANYTSVAAAVKDLPSDSSSQYIYILAGTYNEQVSLNRAGMTVFRGESDSPLDQTQNKVTITQSGALISGGGSSEPYSTFYSQSTTYNSKKSKFYNINFINSYTPTTNYIAIAMDIKAQQVGFYSCGFKSSQGTFLANYGSFYLAGCRIEGSQDFFWGYGAAYVYNSEIVTNTGGYSIAAQSYQSTYGNSQFVFDTCAVVPTSSSIAQSSTYLGRDYSASARVAYINSFIDGHIKPVGWSIGTTGTNVTFVEGNNTGPGSSTSSRASKVTILSDTSSYSAANVLGDISWLDTSAIPPFSGFPDSVYGTTSSSSSSASSSATSASSSGTSTSASTTVSSSSSSSTSSSAACPTATLTVMQNTTDPCQYTNISAAVSALASDGLEKTILVYPGTYNEQVSITRSGKVNLIGQTSFKNDFTQNQVVVQYNDGVSTSAGQDETTPVLNSKKNDLAVYNINFHNTFPKTTNYAALAGDFYGSNMAFYGCSFIGFQDTLLLNKGVQVLSNSYIEGSVDFIWGFSTAFLHGCYIAANSPGASICAMSRASASTVGGYVIDSSLVTYTSTYGSSMGLTYLGRPYSNYSRVVYTNSYLDSNINSAGWSVWQTSNPQTNNVLFGEYNNVGPSSSTANRASFATQLNSTAAQAYTLSNWVGDTSWIDMTTYNLAPSYTWTNSSVNATGTATATSSSTSSSSTASATSTCGHPSSGTEAPTGAVIVDATNATTGSYSSLTAALAALPSDSTCQTIFMMPGTYIEQANVNRPGQTRIIGYTTSSPGAGYSGNQVTVSYSRDLSVSPLPTGHSDAETAVITTTSSGIAFYNVNFINTANLDGSTSSDVALAGSIYGSHIGFYGCSFTGWQDTLLTGSTAGYQYYESCYIEGAIDFIWGYSAAYFKGCTIEAKRKSSAITAHNRASSSAIGIYVFDECLVTAPSAYSSAIQSSVYLGRPYSAYARVVYKYSYLDSIIAPAGWKVWSTTDPRTDHITFAEYQNTGPGNWENNAAAREAFQNCTLLTSDTYTLSSVMDSTSWIDMTYWNNITVPSAPTATASATTSSTASATATATKASSTEPGDGDYIVSQTPIDGETVYSTISDALTAISGISSKTTVTVFIYPGTYAEQLTYNRSGTTIFRGYSTSPSDNTKNQVIVQNSYGVDTQADQSNSDSATLYTRAKYIQMYNINLNNVFGTTDDYASLGFAIGNNGYAGFYGCQITGNQDTFDLNSGTSVFAYNTLIEGSIDFIWGAGSAYFLSSTIVPNADGGCMTADKRAANTSVGGMVFDQCTVAAASGVSAGSIYLGRPYSQYAKVAWVESYLDSSVAAAGWSVWSKSNPQTDGVLFGEYHNTGPGSSTSARASFSEQLSDTDVVQFQLANFFSTQGTSWINFTYVDTTPFVAGSYPNTTTTISSITTRSSTSSTSVPVTYTTIYTTVPVTVTSTLPGSTVTATKTSTVDVTTTDPAVTVTITSTSVDKETASNTITASDTTKYTTVKATVGGTSTVTPDAVIVTKFTTVSVTVGSTSTVSPPTSTVTRYSTVSTTVGSSVTVTPDPSVVTKYSTVSTTVGSSVTVTPVASTVYDSSTVTTTVDVTSTKAGSTTTVTDVDTVSTTSTSSPAAKTVTVTSTSYSTVTQETTAKGTTKTSTVTTVTLAGTTKTTTPKATTTYVTSTSTVSKTVKVTTTLACSPAAKVKRTVPADRFHIRGLASTSTSKITIATSTTAATAYTTAKPTTVTSTYTTYETIEKTAKASTYTEVDTVTSFAKTVTSTIPGATVTSTVSSVSTIDATTTLKASTTTTTSTATVTSSITAVTTLKGGSTTITDATTVTSTIAGTTTLKASTTTTTSTSTVTSSITGTTTLKASTVTSTTVVTATKTSTVSVTAPVSTVSVTSTQTIASVVTLPQTTNTITSVKSATTTVTSTEAAPTVEVDKTATVTAAAVTVTAAQSTVTKTTTTKSTTSIYTTTTKYASKSTCAA